jgi:hypothetical protein
MSTEAVLKFFTPSGRPLKILTILPIHLLWFHTLRPFFYIDLNTLYPKIPTVPFRHGICSGDRRIKTLVER